ncbi:MAG: hypothetical protein U9Q79_10385 [Candidatus Hydrogenedentes bacterium]|nr:hypothetical protein [Candidatus Hydrogenedentota bacterium]
MNQSVEPTYRRLGPGTDIWLGPDHVLYLSRNFFTERVKRFQYGDIQALALRETKSYVRWHIILLVLAAFFSLPLIAGLVNDAPWWGLVLLGFPSMAILAVSLEHWRLGPTCGCHIRTAVQIEELKSLRRLRTARPAFHLLCQEVARVQEAAGTGTPEDTDLAALYAHPEALDTAKPVVERRLPQRRDYNGWAHALLFLSLLLSAVISAIALGQLDRLVFILGLLNLAMILAFLVAALVMQHTREVSRELRIMGWVCTIYIVVSNAISGATTPVDFFQFLFFSGEINVWEHQTYLMHIIITMAIELALSLFGLYFVATFRSRVRKESQTRITAAFETPPAKNLFEEKPGKDLP